MGTRRSTRRCNGCGKGGRDLLECTDCSNKFHLSCISSEAVSSSKQPMLCSSCLAKVPVPLAEEPASAPADTPSVRVTRAGKRTAKEAEISGAGKEVSDGEEILEGKGKGTDSTSAGEKESAALQEVESVGRKRGRRSNTFEGNPVTPSQELERVLREKKGKAVALEDEAVSKESSGDEALNLDNEVFNQDNRSRHPRGKHVGGNGDGAEKGGNRRRRRDNRDGNRMEQNREQWAEIARRRAAHFAHFDKDEELGDAADQQRRGNRRGRRAPVAERRVEEESEEEVEAELEEDEVEVFLVGDEDAEAQWPGPFAEARRLQRRRAAARAERQVAQGTGAREKPKVVAQWTPSRGKAGPWQGGAQEVAEFPSLFELCVRTLCAEVEAVVSLVGIPDVVRKRVSAALCDRRKLTAPSMRLLFEGLPTEVSAFDCTLVTEPELGEAMKDCSLERLEVLELAMCGRCVSDNLLDLTVGKQPGGLACLNRLGLRGAYRLSDRGLSTILKAAPALVDVELSQCSLITDAGVVSIAESVGPQLRRFSIEGCAQLRGPAILNSLLKMTSLERLSLSGVGSIQDNIVCEIAVTLGSRLRELNLRRCSELTDTAVAGVAACCPELEVLDLDEIPLLTDGALASLGEGCRSIRTLLLKRGKFSDEALSTFVSKAGAGLRELSLNCVWQVEDGTLIELARHAKETLVSIDVSFCRYITDAALGLLADSCLRLRRMRMFGCSQVTGTFLHGHSNENLIILGRGDENHA